MASYRKGYSPSAEERERDNRIMTATPMPRDYEPGPGQPMSPRPYGDDQPMSPRPYGDDQRSLPVPEMVTKKPSMPPRSYGDDQRSIPVPEPSMPELPGKFSKGKQYSDNPELNDLYNQLQMQIMSGGGVRMQTPEESAASSQKTKMLEQAIISAGGKPYEHFTRLPHGSFDEYGPGTDYDPMTGRGEEPMGPMRPPGDQYQPESGPDDIIRYKEDERPEVFLPEPSMPTMPSMPSMPSKEDVLRDMEKEGGNRGPIGPMGPLGGPRGPMGKLGGPRGPGNTTFPDMRKAPGGFPDLEMFREKYQNMPREGLPDFVKESMPRSLPEPAKPRRPDQGRGEGRSDRFRQIMEMFSKDEGQRQRRGPSRQDRRENDRIYDRPYNSPRMPDYNNPSDIFDRIRAEGKISKELNNEPYRLMPYQPPRPPMMMSEGGFAADQAAALADGGDRNNDGYISKEELLSWRPSDGRYGRNPNNRVNRNQSYSLNALNFLQDRGAELGEDGRFLSDEEFWKYDARRQQKEGRNYGGATLEGEFNYQDPSTWASTIADREDALSGNFGNADIDGDGEISDSEFGRWRPSDGRYGRNPNNRVNPDQAYSQNALDSIRNTGLKSGYEMELDKDGRFTDEEFWKFDAARQQGEGKDYGGATMIGEFNYQDPSTWENQPTMPQPTPMPTPNSAPVPGPAQNPYVFGGYGSPPPQYAGMADPRMPNIVGMAPPSYYGGEEE